jgi:hypothetical protein
MNYMKFINSHRQDLSVTVSSSEYFCHWNLSLLKQKSVVQGNIKQGQAVWNKLLLKAVE